MPTVRYDDTARDDLENALTKILGVAESLIQLGHKAGSNEEVFGYLGGQLEEHRDDALDAYCRVFKTGPYAAAEAPAINQTALRERLAVIVAEFDTPLPEGDAGLVEAARRLPLVRERRDALDAEFGTGGTVDHRIKVEEEINRHCWPLIERFFKHLVRTDAQTPEGALVKLRFALNDDAAPLDDEDDATSIIASVLPLIERLAAGGAA